MGRDPAQRGLVTVQWGWGVAGAELAGTWEGAARRGHQAALECVQGTGRGAAGDH